MTSLNLKPLARIIALFVMMTVAGTALFATEINPSVVLKKGIEKSFALYMNYPSAKTFQVTLKDNSSKVLFNEKVKQSKEFAKLFDMSKLPVGIYSLTIEDEQSIYTQVIKKKKQGLTIDKDKESKIFKPTIYRKGEKVYLSALVLGGGSAEVVVRDKSGDLIFRELLKDQARIEKVFSFAGQNPEDYSLSIHYKDQVFYFNSLESVPTIDK